MRIFAGVMRETTYLRLLSILFAALICTVCASAARGPKVKYPGGKYYIWRYTLKDKEGSPYSIEHPSRWLSHKSIERRRRQGLPIDSTDLPVSPQYLKTFENTASETVRGDRKKSTEWVIIGTSRWHNSVLVRSNDTTLLNRLSTLPCVKEVRKVWTSPDSINRETPKFNHHDSWNPWDSIKGEIYGNGKEQIEMLHGHRLHSIGMKGKGITIAVLDGGFQNCDVIPAITKANILGTKDFVYPNSTHFYRETDHGTKVLSTMASNEPQVMVGTAPEARYWLLRSEDSQTEQPVEEDYWTMAAEFADSAGGDLINSSLGYNDFDKGHGSHKLWQLDGHSTLISHSASMIAKKAMILVNSAGNTGMGPWKKLTFPADAEDCLTVGAVTDMLTNAPFSSVGPTQDGRVKPDVVAIGSPATVVTGRGSIAQDMGTSFATPVICGLAACLWQALPNMTAHELMELIRQTSNNKEHPDNIYGYGLPNFWKAYMIGKVQSSTVNDQ